MSEAKYEYTGVKLPRDVKKRVRAIAAERETSIAQMSLELLLLGLDAYLKGEHLDLDAGQAKELAEALASEKPNER